MNDRRIGWAFVALQVVLLGALILLPGGSAWPRPGWLTTAGSIVTWSGLALIAIAALGLGTGLTPTPVPRDAGRLVTGGLFRFARHPIYSGVLLCVAGIAVPSGSVVIALVAVVTVVFFVVKSSWEEERLRERYLDYDAYAATTGRFFPKLGSR